MVGWKEGAKFKDMMLSEEAGAKNIKKRPPPLDYSIFYPFGDSQNRTKSFCYQFRLSI